MVLRIVAESKLISACQGRLTVVDGSSEASTRNSSLRESHPRRLESITYSTPSAFMRGRREK